jgi:hypothetical protein
VYDECGNMPHHNKHTETTAQQKHAGCIHTPQILWSQKQRLCAKVCCKIAGKNGSKHHPKYKKELIAPEVQQKKLHRQKEINAPKYMTHNGNARLPVQTT